MTESHYAYDQAWEQERARLAGIEALWDDGTHDVLLANGVTPGAAVLEVGAGGGSVVEWLAGEVGPSGRVVALDLDVRFVDRLASDVVEVQSADVVRDELPDGEFDVVHARLLLEHLAEAPAVIDKLARALRPGGTLVIEDYDWTAFGFDPSDEQTERGAQGIMAFMTLTGFDRLFGRRLVGLLDAAGLADVRGAGRSLIIDRSHPGYPFFRLSFEQLAGPAVQAGTLLANDAQEVGERLRSGAGQRVITPVLIAGIGIRPA
jgi:ubiquinone/menaquinone biosynthesis C-methylase UbiE